ncbi:MAG: MBL fold metallo-hydrolase [Aristaeellaceae bacterium]
MAGKLCVKELTVGLLGTCCYLVWREGREDCVVIDPGAEPERIRRAAEGRRMAAILLTHGHFDHIGGVAELMGDDTELVIHRLDAPMLQSTERNVCWMIGETITAPEATVLVKDGDVISFAGIDFTVLHTPGHTPGGACYQAEDALFTGDTMFHQGYGRTDLPGGSDAELGRSLNRLYPLARKCTVYPGHGG